MLRALLAASITWLAAAGSAEDLSQSLPVHVGGSLQVELAFGRVELHRSPDDVLRVEARARGVGASAVHFATAARGDDLVLVSNPEPWLELLRSGPSVRVRVWAPPHFPVTVHSSRGPVEVDDRRGLTRAARGAR
jgi:hypothetical protein